jgi:acetylglutamate kinase
MIPKLEEACAAIDGGVRDVRIVAPAEIATALIGGEQAISVGTRLRP